MSPDDAYRHLVEGLLGARVDPATARFDAELAAAVAAGAVPADVADTLTFWQRLSLRLLVDHSRRVLPTALGALDAAREAATTDVLHRDGRAGGDEPPDRTRSQPPAAGSDRTAETGPSTDRTIDLEAPATASRHIVAGLTPVSGNVGTWPRARDVPRS